MTIEELEKEEKELRMLLIKNQEQQLEINKKLFLEKWGFKIGDEVKYQSGSNLIFAIIAGIFCRATEVGYYYVNIQSKNGKTYQQRQVRVWPSELETMKKI